MKVCCRSRPSRVNPSRSSSPADGQVPGVALAGDLVQALEPEQAVEDGVDGLGGVPLPLEGRREREADLGLQQVVVQMYGYVTDECFVSDTLDRVLEPAGLVRVGRP